MAPVLLTIYRILYKNKQAISIYNYCVVVMLYS